ncbi:MAG TPA: DUF2267 domain-containing protein [Nostocaceae cyanobacterium]|nr:DUF2267 domain-containing protein [Nostocaceae cyanobacterium]
MEYSEFITHVQTLTQSDSLENAVKATRATLETLKEHLPQEEVEELAAQLPQELSECLHNEAIVNNQSFPLLEFIERTSQKENIEPTTAAMHVRAVFAVLENAINPEIFARFHKYFPHDYEELFTISSTSEMPA